jgi:hypothetical protein
MANQIAIVYIEVDTAGASIGSLKCRKTSWADLSLLSESADERYLAIHILHQQADTGPPNSLILNGKELASLKYTPARGSKPEKVDIKPYDVAPENARQHTLEGNTQANNRQILNRVIPSKLGSAAAHDVSFVLYDTSNSDYDSLDSQAFNYDVMDDLNCELLP